MKSGTLCTNRRRIGTCLQMWLVTVGESDVRFGMMRFKKRLRRGEDPLCLVQSQRLGLGFVADEQVGKR